MRDLADIVYLTNEYDLGDFGVGGMTFTQHGFSHDLEMWTESLFRERGIRAILRAHVTGRPRRRSLRAARRVISSLFFDFAMFAAPVPGVPT